MFSNMLNICFITYDVDFRNLNFKLFLVQHAPGKKITIELIWMIWYLNKRECNSSYWLNVNYASLSQTRIYSQSLVFRPCLSFLGRCEVMFKAGQIFPWDHSLKTAIEGWIELHLWTHSWQNLYSVNVLYEIRTG